MHSLFTELKRRHVFRVVAVYAAVAFIVLQVVSLLVPVLLLPGWTYRLVGILLIVGLPVATVVAWAFEVTPEGVRRTGKADDEERAVGAPRPDRRRRRAAMLVTAGVAVLLAGGWFALGGGGGGEVGVASDVVPGDPASSAPSMAVLPFANIAGTEETEPFVEGVHDDLLTRLSQIGSLRVISRTSVQEYRNTTKNIRQIADELGVNHVLEGGVQRSGEQVRINVQLIDARTDEHLWAETYDRTLTVANVFAIQSDIATAIAEALRAELSPDVRRRIASLPTESLEAYDHYQRGMAYFRHTFVGADVRRAAREFEAALRIDPEFADAWARLAIARLTLSWDFGYVDEVAAAEAAILQAEALAPEHVLTHVARGYLHYYGRREYDAALEAFRKAEALSPGDPEILLPIGWVYRRQGRWDEAIEKFDEALARDPRNWDNVYGLGHTMLVLRRFSEAERYLELAISMAPDLANPYGVLALLSIMESGDTASAAAIIERGAERVGRLRVLFDFPVVSRVMARRFGRAGRAATSSIAGDSSGIQTQWVGQEVTLPAFFLLKAQLLRTLGDTALARVHFDSARAVLEPLARRIGPEAIWSDQGSLQTALGIVYAALGRKAEAIRYGRAGMKAVEGVGDALTGPFRRADLAEIYVTVGEPELALDELQRLLAGPGPVSVASLQIDPLWAPLRSRPRFQALLAEASAAGGR